MKIKINSLYSQKSTLKELNQCKKSIASARLPSEISLLNEKIKFLETHCEQFKKMHIEWKGLNHRIDGKMKNLALSKAIASPSPARPQQTKNTIKHPSATYLPYLGLGLGTITGLIERIASFRPLDFKDKKLVKKIFEDLPVLQGINQLKQSEIKNFSLLLPLLPLAAQVIRDTFNGPRDQKVAERFKSALETHATFEQRVYVLAAIMGMIGAACCPKGAAEESFDPSGHIMLKTLLTTLTVKTLSAALAQTSNKSVILSSKTLYGALALADAIFIHATVSVCHTVPEIAAGFAAAWTISALARKAIQTLQPVRL